MPAPTRSWLPAWAAGVFLCALLARLAFLVLVDQPLLYTHQYNYFNNALRIATHPEPLRYIVTDEAWRTWDRNWTLAPLYHVFAGFVLRLFALSLPVLQVLQCFLDAGVAVLVGALGRRVAGPWGAAAGFGYALYAPAVEMPSWTMTENLHTPLLVLGFWLAVRAWDAAPAWRPALLAGFVLGVSALARSVTSAFIGLAALAGWALGRRAGRSRWALAMLAGGACAILPWTARNVFVVGDHILIESTAFENIWFANRFVDGARFHRQQAYVHSRPTPAEKREAALHFAWRGTRRHPELFIEKIRRNFWHLLRPEGLQSLLRAERSFPPWRHIFYIGLDDTILMLAVGLFPVFIVAGRSSPTRTLLLTWVAYYLLMIVVVFHNEIRYRSALVPFLFVAAVGAWDVLRSAAASRWRHVLGLTIGLLLVLFSLDPFLGPARRALAARRALDRALSAVGSPSAAWQDAAAAAALNPGSPTPWFDLGRALAWSGDAAGAARAYGRGQAANATANVRALVALPRVLRESGERTEVDRALIALHRFEWNFDPWLLQEAAWRELPAPRADSLAIGGDDTGAILGFFHPRGGDPRLSAHRLEWTKYAEPDPVPPPGPHRWTRHRAWVRLAPTVAAGVYRVTLVMGSPFPSPIASPEVTVSSGGAVWRFSLDRELRSYVLDRVPGERGVVVVRIDSPTWNRVGEPAEQGVRVDRVSVEPTSP